MMDFCGFSKESRQSSHEFLNSLYNAPAKEVSNMRLFPRDAMAFSLYRTGRAARVRELRLMPSGPGIRSMMCSVQTASLGRGGQF